MDVRSAMTPDPACCTQSASLRAVAGLMIDNDCGEIPVVDDHDRRRPIGVITDRDIAVRAVAQGVAPDEGRVGDYMTTPCITVHPEDTLQNCCALMERHQIRRVLVVDKDERLCGIVSLADVAMHAERRATGEVVKEVSEPV
jgi:CBS domain-containing protein